MTAPPARGGEAQSATPIVPSPFLDHQDADDDLVLGSLGRRGDVYSYFVGFMKLALPLGALLLVALVMLWPRLEQTKDDIQQSISTLIKPEDIENLQMVNPRYSGVDQLNRPFVLTADVARKRSADSKVVALEQPAADLTLEDGAWLAMTATEGSYFEDLDLLDLAGNVNIYHDGGYAVETTAARVDLGLGRAEGSAPVVVHGPAGQIEAEGFRVENKGQTVYFTGKSKLVLHSEDRGIGTMFQPPTPASESKSPDARATQ